MAGHERHRGYQELHHSHPPPRHAPDPNKIRPPTRVIAPAAFLDEIRALLTGPAPVTLTVGAAAVSIDARGRQVTAQPLDDDFPDYRRVLAGHLRSDLAHRATVDVAGLRAALAPGAAPSIVREHHGVRYDVAILAIDTAGELAILGEDSWRADDTGTIAVNREFLLDALEAGGRGQLVLELDGPITPLAIRPLDENGSLSILMPVRM